MHTINVSAQKIPEMFILPELSSCDSPRLPLYLRLRPNILEIGGTYDRL